MSISTKTGDNGTTSFLGGGQVPKDHPRIECLGTLDELNVFLGAVRCAAVKTRTGEIIKTVQEELLVISGIIAGGQEPAPDTSRLDNRIAELEAALPPLRSFIIPGANPASVQLHIARTVCRRAERRLVSLNSAELVPPGLLRYMNRLSDMLFLLARVEDTEVNHDQ
ncbi:ATP--cob(I)alamin adenosyltransferase [Spirochaetia bacterium]|nr:ATP--cob(I)alamin adenosyltransferase [Spirochaetia bacterium]